MKYELSDTFCQFFMEHGLIEFESILLDKELELISSLTQKELSSSHSDPWNLTPPIWQKNSDIKKILFKSPVGEIASFLYKKKPLRLGFLQLISSHHKTPFSEPRTIEEIASITPTLGGALLCLSSEVPLETQSPLPDLSAPKKGSMFFFSNKTPIPFPALHEQKNLLCLLFCFVSTKVRYKLNPLDSHTHDLKRFGYAFGDLVKADQAPFLFH
jgi:hypothetical protein